MHTTTTSNPTTSRTQRLVRAGLVALVAGTVFVGCSDTTESADSRIKSAAAVADLAAGATTSTVKEAAGNIASNPEGDTTQTGGQAPSPAPAPGPAPAPAPPTTVPTAPAPTIDSFWTPENIDCHNGDFQMFTASWETTNAVSVTISIDGPGIYDTYPADHETSLPFNCSSPHTFLLTAHGSDGQTTSQTITLHPRNVQTPNEDDDEL